MSYPLDSDVQEDVRTFPMYQRLRKINPYAYYSLNIRKQMQSDLRNFGSLTFFEQNIDDIPEVPEPTHSIELPKALADAEHMLDTGSPEFNQKAETILSVLYASDTVPIRRCALHGDKHKVFAAVKNKVVRSAPFKLQYVARASDSEEAYDVKECLGLGLPKTNRCEAGTSMSAIRI